MRHSGPEDLPRCGGQSHFGCGRTAASPQQLVALDPDGLWYGKDYGTVWRGLAACSTLQPLPSATDFVIFSGGKAVRGPQTSGLLLGRSELIESARLNGSPNEVLVERIFRSTLVFSNAL